MNSGFDLIRKESSLALEACFSLPHVLRETERYEKPGDDEDSITVIMLTELYTYLFTLYSSSVRSYRVWEEDMISG